MPADRERAEQQDEAECGVGHQVEQRVEAAQQPGLLHLRPVDLGRPRGVPPGRLAAAAERLEHPDAAGRFLDIGGQVALLVLGAPGQHLVPPLEPRAHRHHGREHAAGEQPEPPVQPDEQDHHGREGRQAGDEEDEAESGEPPDRRQIRGSPRQQLAGLPRIVEARVQPLHVRVEITADRPLDAGDGAGLHPAADQHARGLRGPEADRSQAERDEQPAPVLGDRSVDHSLGEQRDSQLGGHGEQGGAEHDRQLPEIGPQVRGDPPQSRDRGSRCGQACVTASAFRGHCPQANRVAAGCHLSFRKAAAPRRGRTR